MSSDPSAEHWTDRVVRIAEEAGREILAVYAETDSDRGERAKDDGSPVTLADLRAEAVILAGLALDGLPRFPVVAEESVAAGRVPALDGEPFWLVDPLDGTKEFLSRNGEFTVNIALVRAGVPVFGVVHAPTLGTTYVGALDDLADLSPGTPEPVPSGPGAHRLEPAPADPAEPPQAYRIAVAPPPSEGLRALVSRSHLDPRTEEWLAALPAPGVAVRLQVGSSLKFCRIAEGSADVYPRLAPTMEWDTAAGHAVLAAAGGAVRRLDGEPLRYGLGSTDQGARPFANPEFVASSVPIGPAAHRGVGDRH